MQSLGGEVEVLEERNEAADGVNGVSEDEGSLVRVVEEARVEVEVLPFVSTFSAMEEG